MNSTRGKALLFMMRLHQWQLKFLFYILIWIFYLKMPLVILLIDTGLLKGQRKEGLSHIRPLKLLLLVGLMKNLILEIDFL